MVYSPVVAFIIYIKYFYLLENNEYAKTTKYIVENVESMVQKQRSDQVGKWFMFFFCNVLHIYSAMQ